MNCCICTKPTNYKVKNLIVCHVCIKKAQELRDHLNSTRKNPQSLLNPMGETPVTLREVILRTMAAKENLNEVS